MTIFAVSILALLFMPQSPSLIGVWEPVEVTVAPDARGHGSDAGGPAGPGIWIFTARYYSHMSVNGREPRKPLPRQNRTVKDYEDAWGTFGANAGTYQVSDTILTMYQTLAKQPQNMTPGFKNELGFRVRGDTLWMWSIGNRLGSGVTVRYRRIE